jgi:pimeloyl-ACP methyl ester carboxylesterase
MRECVIDSDRCRLFAVADGSGLVVVMLHGAMANHLAALPLVAPLVDAYRIITPDLRGSGKSWCPEPLTFDDLAADVVRLLDHVGVDRAVVGGVSSGSGVALRVALRYPERTLGLIIVNPVYAGEAGGYTEQQRSTFRMMDAVASRAVAEGVQVLRPLFAHLPEPIREKAWAIAETFDPASVVATSHFMASGAQPFRTVDDLKTLTCPVLLVPADDPLHPGEVSKLYASAIPNCTVMLPPAADVTGAIRHFVEQCRGA